MIHIHSIHIHEWILVGEGNTHSMLFAAAWCIKYIVRGQANTYLINIDLKNNYLKDMIFKLFPIRVPNFVWACSWYNYKHVH